MRISLRVLFRLVILLALIPVHTGFGQQVGLKTNALYWATTTPNLAVEVAANNKITLELSGAYNPWNFGSGTEIKKIEHWITKFETRLWQCEKFDGGFWGFHGFFGSYNAGGFDIPIGDLAKMKNSRFEGYMIGAGVSYGWQWYLGAHWNLEASVGLGYAYLNYDEYECRTCGNKLGKEIRHWVGPTKIGVSFVYLFKSKK